MFTSNSNGAMNKSKEFKVTQLSLSHPYPEQGYCSTAFAVIDVTDFKKMTIGSITNNSGTVNIYDYTTPASGAISLNPILTPNNGVYDLTNVNTIYFNLSVSAAGGWASATVNNITFY